jgi:hypothetical protein
LTDAQWNSIWTKVIGIWSYLNGPTVEASWRSVIGDRQPADLMLAVGVLARSPQQRPMPGSLYEICRKMEEDRRFQMPALEAAPMKPIPPLWAGTWEEVSARPEVKSILDRIGEEF